MLKDTGYIFGEIYRSPNSNEIHFLETYERLISQLKQGNKNLVIGTDQNLDLLKFHKHANTAELLDIITYHHGNR